MSALPCARRECANIMCRRLILGRSQYICDRCWQELLKLKASWPDTMKGSEVKQAILDFLDTVPGSSDGLTVDEAFRNLTGCNQNENLEPNQ